MVFVERPMAVPAHRQVIGGVDAVRQYRRTLPAYAVVHPTLVVVSPMIRRITALNALLVLSTSTLLSDLLMCIHI